MKRLLTVMYFCITLLFLISCKRLDGETVVEGQVVDGHTGQPVPDATVGVYVNSSNAMWGGYTKDFEKQADGKGNFSFRFDGDGSKDYQLRASTSKGGSPFPNEAINIRQGRNNKNLKLKLQSPAWLRVKLVNQFPKDSIWIDIWPFDDNDLSLQMLMHDTTIISRVFGNETRQINWEFTNSRGQKVKDSKEFYFPGSDTIDLTIEY